MIAKFATRHWIQDWDCGNVRLPKELVLESAVGILSVVGSKVVAQCPTCKIWRGEGELHWCGWFRCACLGLVEGPKRLLKDGIICIAIVIKQWPVTSISGLQTWDLVVSILMIILVVPRGQRCLILAHCLLLLLQSFQLSHFHVMDVKALLLGYLHLHVPANPTAGWSRGLHGDS